MKLVFQPAEEGGAGGQLMVDGGAIEGVDMAFAMHVAPKVGGFVYGTQVYFMCN